MRGTSFEYIHHLVTVPVLLNGIERRFVLDSGIGLTVVRDSLDGCALTGASFTGKRMSGQQIAVPLARAPRLEFAGVAQSHAEVGFIDMSGFPPEFADVDGFLSLAFFTDQPFSVDYGKRIVRYDPGATGTSIAVRIERDGPTVTAFMPLSIPGGRAISVEVDMGSDSLILHERLAAEAGVDLRGQGARREEGLDETGNHYTRTFTRLSGAIHPIAAPELAQQDPDVMFQRIIYDGLLGHAFLKMFTVTWDIPGARIVLAPTSLG